MWKFVSSPSHPAKQCSEQMACICVGYLRSLETRFHFSLSILSFLCAFQRPFSSFLLRDHVRACPSLQFPGAMQSWELENSVPIHGFQSFHSADLHILIASLSNPNLHKGKFRQSDFNKSYFYNWNVYSDFYLSFLSCSTPPPSGLEFRLT